MGSHILLALLIGGAAGGWLYFKLSQRSLERGGKNFAAAIIGGVFVFIIVLSLAAKFL